MWCLGLQRSRAGDELVVFVAEILASKSEYLYYMAKMIFAYVYSINPTSYTPLISLDVHNARAAATPQQGKD